MNWWLLWFKFVFLATGVWWGLGMQWLYNMGAAHPLSMLVNFDWYCGMMLSALPKLISTPKGQSRLQNVGLPMPKGWDWRYYLKHMVPIALCDFLGTCTTTVGLDFAGSGIFGIIYSSVTVWAAIFAWLLLRKAMSWRKWGGIVVVMAGLCITAVDEDLTTEHGFEQTVGILLISFGTIGYGLEFALCEQVFVQDGAAVEDLCLHLGILGCLFNLGWFAVVTYPRWQELVVGEIEEKGGNYNIIGFLFFSKMLGNWWHNVTWFIVCEKEGGVSTGLLQGLKAVCLFVASSAVFCHDYPSQCLTLSKCIAIAVVCAGVGMYYSPEAEEDQGAAEKGAKDGLELLPTAEDDEMDVDVQVVYGDGGMKALPEDGDDQAAAKDRVQDIGVMDGLHDIDVDAEYTAEVTPLTAPDQDRPLLHSAS